MATPQYPGVTEADLAAATVSKNFRVAASILMAIAHSIELSVRVAAVAIVTSGLFAQASLRSGRRS
jgi:hypothetical protein